MSDAGDKPLFRKSLRNANINYSCGWFFVTSQVAHNKLIFGTIVGEKVVLNDLGQRVLEYWQGMPERYPELEIFESVLMPNHFHALIRIHYRATNHEHHLGFLMSRFKGGAGYIYGKMRRAGLVEDIGEHLWQFDYWDDLVTSDNEFAAQAKYIRENPANWSRDCLRRALSKGKRIIQVIPQGIPLERELSPELAAACREGRALLLSPQQSGSRLNKKVATWCNEYVLRNADEIWVGDISQNGMLHAMIKGLGKF